MSSHQARLFFSRFLRRPLQVASVIPSSKVLVDQVLSSMDLASVQAIAELGPGEGVQTRELLKQIPADARVFLFEVDEVLAESLKRQFQHDARVTVFEENALNIKQVLKTANVEQIDYVFSGIPFSLMARDKKTALLRDVSSVLRPGGAFVSYQVTRELNQYAQDVFDAVESEHCWLNFPPMYVSRYRKGPAA